MNILFFTILLLAGTATARKPPPLEAPPEEPTIAVLVDEKFHFNNDGEVVGTLDWSTGKLKFKGNAGHSAQLFFDFLKYHIDFYIDHKCSQK